MKAYYNENDQFAADWLFNLMMDGLIPAGEIDTRSIEEVQGHDVKGFDQCHFFAGIGGWSYALQIAAWEGQVWTGSCPCQPFSAAGKRQGVADKRHLWPEMRRLVAECAPPVVFGEQVASKDGRLWLAGVRTDLEALGYAVGAADLCAAGVRAPHIRQRLYWVADSKHTERWAKCEVLAEAHGRDGSGGRCDLGRMADADIPGMHKRTPGGEQSFCDWSGEASIGMGHADDEGLQGRRIDAGERPDQRTAWSSGIFIPCADGKARRIEPSIQPLAHGVPNRMGTLRGAGNAIVPQVAAAFVGAYLDTLN